MQWTVYVTIFKGKIKAGGTHTPNPWSVFSAHLVGELRGGSQPTAPTCVVWSWRLIDCFAHSAAVGAFWDMGFPRSLPPFIVWRLVQSQYNNTSKERNLSTNHGTFVSSVHLFKYLVIRNRLNKGREHHPFNFVLSCARVSLKFLQFALVLIQEWLGQALVYKGLYMVQIKRTLLSRI